MLDSERGTRQWEEGRHWYESGKVKGLYLHHAQLRAIVDDPHGLEDYLPRGAYFNLGKTPLPLPLASINFPPIDPTESKLLAQTISADPVLVDELMAYKITERLYNTIEQWRSFRLPTLSDLRFQCSCPSRMRPCSHEIALLYSFADEVEADPLQMLRALGCDLYQNLAYYCDLRFPPSPFQGSIPYSWDLVERRPNTGVHAYGNLQPLRLKEYYFDRKVVLNLLDDNAPFYPQGNFKAIYARTLQGVQRALDRVVSGKRNLVRAFPRGNACISVGPTTEMPATIGSTNWQTNIMGLLTMSHDRLHNCHPSVYVNYWALRAAIHLIQVGAVAPRITCDDNNNYWTLWMPATVVSEVARMMNDLEAMMEPNLLAYPTANKEDRPLVVRHQAEWLVGCYVNTLIRCLTPKTREEDWSEFFFKDVSEHCIYNRNRLMPTQAEEWLRPLWIASSGALLPILKVEPDKEGSVFLLSFNAAYRHDKTPIPISLQELFFREPGSHNLYTLCAYLNSLKHLIPELPAYLEQQARTPICYNTERFLHLLQDVVPLMMLTEFRMLIPKPLLQLLRPRLTLRVRTRVHEPGFLKLGDLLEFNWMVALGDKEITYAEFETLTQEHRQVLRFRDQYVILSPEEAQRLHDAVSKGSNLNEGQMLQVALAEDFDDTPTFLSDEARALLHSLADAPPVALPLGLQATLRPYQERGYAWLHRNMLLGFGSILADDMGLGKTLQTIALLLKLKEEGRLKEQHCLVVVPTSLLTNWSEEIARFAPSLTTAIYHGTNRSPLQLQADVVLTTYGMVRSDGKSLAAKPWAVMVIDEAQNIKNYDAQQTRAICSIPATTHIALSGTPVENRLSEFWSLMNFCNKGYLGSLAQFNARYAKPIQERQDKEVAQRFRRITAPFMMRRMKTDKNIIADLPDKIETNEYVALTTDQTALYQATIETRLDAIRALDTSDHQQDFQRKGLILQLILALKEICNHPTQYLKNEDYRPELSGKTERLLELLQSIADADEKVLIFTQFKAMGDLLSRFIEQRLGQRPLFYHGGCTIEQRNDMVQRFQNNPSDRFFVLSLKAAGTGLNLTAASHVIHYDLWWNPAVEAQATDRAYRIGQHKNVIVHRLIAHHTFEEKIDRLIQQKRHLADLTVASGESWIANLSNDELNDLFRPY